jgi:ribonuclease E
MLISYTPGEECRVAVVENGKLEEFHAERASSISRVGNIYIGTVTNVEPSIQAAFVDFGVEAHGFLHVTDVHPRYFPGEDEEDTTESIGRKTPRRERPPIQKCFKRGDQVEVQVLKEGVGTKGPTLTSYLSIPGRFLVMMPQMDKVGVSRKVEDEEQRREMRQILDQLELPDGFGFILRTAGMDRTKAELKRDLSYLSRLWKDMETRKKSGNKPRLLYSESDLLVRALRDMVSADISEIIIDNELALARAARFLKIVSPRSKVKLLEYKGQTPLFHAFGIEQQIAVMHAREVPLPGGGRLVIDETEALVAIDVNSGKMRDARDAETNAYKTNCEAVEEICRQLKLRDLGGIVINDLIDMRHASHRKDIEQRFRDRLKRDRAKTTTLAISDFGILEMTRQRMRGSHESVHFVDCPTCRGRGMVQKPDSVAADALRNLAALLDHENVARVEMVVAPRVASELLSGRRKTLNKLERTSKKTVDVRVSETVPVDRISFYAYDPQGADIDVEGLPRAKAPKDLKVWEVSGKEDGEEAWTDIKDAEAPESELTESEQAEIAEMPAHPIEIEDVDSDQPLSFETSETGQKRGRRRRGRRGRGGGGGGQEGQRGGQQQRHPQPQRGPAPAATDGQSQQPTAQPVMDGQMGGSPQMPPQGVPIGPDGRPVEGQPGEGGGRRRRRRRRRGRGRGGEGGGEQGMQGGGQMQPGAAPGLPDGAPQEAVPILDEGPRGDSWDVEPGAVPALTRAPEQAPLSVEGGAAAEQPPQIEPASSLEEDEEAPVPGEQLNGAAPSEGGGQGQEGGGRRRRRRRRGRGGRGGDGQQGGQGQGQKQGHQGQHQGHQQGQHQQRQGHQQGGGGRSRDDRQRGQDGHGGGQHNQRQQRQDGPRSGGGYQKRAPDAAPPSTPASPPPPPANVEPKPAQGEAGKPKRLLYTSRRKLSPGEASRLRPPE